MSFKLPPASAHAAGQTIHVPRRRDSLASWTTCPRPACSARCPGTSSPRNGVFLPWLRSAPRSTFQQRSGSKTQMSAARPARGRRRSTPMSFAGSLVICASAAGSGDAFLGRPLERERQQELEPGRAGLGLAERHLLAVVVDRRVVGADDVDRAVGDARAQRRAVARACAAAAPGARSASNQPMSTSRQVQVMDRDVAGDRQALALRGADHRDALRARQPAQVHAHAGVAHQREDRRERDRLRDGRECRRGRGASRPRRRARRRRGRGAGRRAAARADSRTSPRTASRATGAACRRAARRRARTRRSPPR